MRPSAFRCFREEAATLAGFHTGAQLVVDEGHLGDPSVRAHELIHGRIFDETLDGSLHRLVLCLLGETSDDAVRQQLSEVSDFLFQETLLPHERAATYLGVQSLMTREERIAARASLTGQYGAYYEYFADVLPWEDSTFVTFPLAMSLTRIAFHSDRILRTHDLGSLTRERLSGREGPGDRLEAAVRSFSADREMSSRSGVARLFRECMSEARIEAFDPFDDGEWIARAVDGTAGTQRLERIVCTHFEAMVSAASGRSMNLGAPVPPWMGPMIRRLAIRDFDIEFPFLDDHLRYPKGVAMHYASEADRELIGRSEHVGFPSFDPKFVLRSLECRVEDADLCVIFVQVEDDARRFRLHASTVHDGRNSCLPGCGLIVDIESVFGIALHLGGIVARRRIASPAFYVIYTPGGDLSGERVLVPSLPGDMEILPGHLAGVRARTQGMVVRPLIYARRYWSHILNSTVGSLVGSNVRMIDADEAGEVGYRLQLLLPKDPTLIPSFSIMSVMSEHAYRALARHAAGDGRLVIETSEEVPRGLSECVVALWQTLSLV